MDEKASNGSMSQSDTPSAETNHLRLVPTTPQKEVCYDWSPDDMQMCATIFSAAENAGVHISVDCSQAVRRAENPANMVELDQVFLAELGSDEFLQDPMHCGIALMAAGLLQTSKTTSLAIAGQVLATKVETAESGVILGGGKVPDLSGQDEDHVSVH